MSDIREETPVRMLVSVNLSSVDAIIYVRLIRRGGKQIPTLTLSGRHKTEGSGEIDINLSQFVYCIDALDDDANARTFEYIASRPHFVATAESTAESDVPVFLTSRISAEPLAPPSDAVDFNTQLGVGLDVVVKVKSWKHDGTPAPDITFNWSATAKATDLFPPRRRLPSPAPEWLNQVRAGKDKTQAEITIMV
jgi:hypothetical protein